MATKSPDEYTSVKQSIGDALGYMQKGLLGPQQGLKNMGIAHGYFVNAKKELSAIPEPPKTDPKHADYVLAKTMLGSLEQRFKDFSKYLAKSSTDNAYFSLESVKRGISAEKVFPQPSIVTDALLKTTVNGIEGTGNKIDQTEKYLSALGEESRRLRLGSDVTQYIEQQRGRLKNIRDGLKAQGKRQSKFEAGYEQKKKNAPVWAFNQPGLRRKQEGQEPTWGFNEPGYELPGVLSRQLREELDAKVRDRELQEKAGAKEKPKAK